MEHKHEIKIKTDQGHFTVSTSDIQDLLTQPVIVKLLGVKKQEATGDSLSTNELNELRNMISTLQRDRENLQQQIEDMKSSVAPEELPELPPQQQRLQPQHPQQQMQHPQPQTPQPQPASARQRLPPTTFLEIPPDQMQPNIWNGLNSEQQQEWMRKYNIA